MKKSIYISLLIGCLSFLTACESEYEIQNLFPEKYRKILYVQQSAIQSMTLYKTGEDFTYTFSVFKGGSDVSLTAAAHISPMTAEEVNALYGITGENYQIVPQQSFALETTDVTFTSADTYKLVNVRLKPELIEEIMAEGDANAYWILPFKVTSDTDSINATKNHILMHFTDIAVPSVGFEFGNVNIKECVLNNLSDLKEIIPVAINVDNHWDIDCELELDESYVEEYNRTYGANYKLFPEGICSFNDKVTIPKGNKRGNLHITAALTQFTEMGDYMLPIRVKSTSKFDISTISLYVLAVRITAPLLDRTGWKATANTEETSDEGSNGFVSNVLDGNTDTYWHSKYSNGYAPLPHDIILDMLEEREVVQVGLAPRKNNRNTKNGKFLMSNDQKTWVEVGDFLMNPSSNSIQSFNTTSMKGRYLKVNITGSYHNNSCTMLSEINVHGF